MVSIHYLKDINPDIYFSAAMPEDDLYPITFDDDELGFGSIFDGYNETLCDEKRSSLLVDFDDDDEEEEEEEKGSSDEEADLKKKWKSSTKTTLNKYVN